jgi:anti-sigma factor (TIGR02949 family)
MGCDDAVRRLWEFLDGGLDETDHRRVEEHLAWCLRCCGEVTFAWELRGLLRTRTGVTLPDGVRRRMERFIDVLGDTTEERSAREPS